MPKSSFENALYIKTPKTSSIVTCLGPNPNIDDENRADLEDLMRMMVEKAIPLCYIDESTFYGRVAFCGVYCGDEEVESDAFMVEVGRNSNPPKVSLLSVKMNGIILLT